MSNTTSTTHASEHSSGASHGNSQKDGKLDGRTSRASSATKRASEDSGNDRTPWSVLLDLGRQQFAMATECSSVLYRNSENVRKIQQDIAHEASLRHADAAKKLFTPRDLSEVMPIQSELLRGDLQSASQYWQQLTSATLQAQREMMDSMNRMLDSDKGGGVKSALDAMQAVPALASSFLVAASNRQNEQLHDS